MAADDILDIDKEKPLGKENYSIDADGKMTDAHLWDDSDDDEWAAIINDLYRTYKPTK